MAQQAAGFGAPAAHLWVARVCLALSSPARVSLVSQAVQVCQGTFWVADLARTWPALTWRFTWVVRTSEHLGQAMRGNMAGEGAGDAFG